MPAIAVHTWLAMELMDRWPKHLEPRLDWNAPTIRNAFFNGCMGPDMGLFPGADAFLSDVVHYVETAQLVRVLLSRASQPIEVAFAVGWASHFWADVRLHPVVNEGVRAAYYPERSLPVPYGDDPYGHASVEVGVDGVWYQTNSRDESGAFRSCFDSESIAYLFESLRETYGEVWSKSQILASHRACARYGRLLLRAFRIQGARDLRRTVAVSDWPFWLGVLVPLQSVSRLLPQGSPMRGILNPLRPTDELMKQWNQVSQSYFSEFFDLMAKSFSGVPNFNMDLGREENAATPYRLALDTRQKLAAARRKPAF